MVEWSRGARWILRLAPEAIRTRLRPFPSLDHRIDFPALWEVPGRPTVSMVCNRGGRGLLATGASIHRWSEAGCPSRLAVVGQTPPVVGLEGATRQLGIEEVTRVDYGGLAQWIAPHRDGVVLIPGPFGGEGAGASWLHPIAQAVSRNAWVAFHDGDGLGLVNSAVRLDASEVAARDAALGHLGPGACAEAMGLAEYRCFTACFDWGQAEVYLRLRGFEYKKLAPLLEKRGQL